MDRGHDGHQVHQGWATLTEDMRNMWPVEKRGPSFASRLHSAVTLVGSRAETSAPPRRFLISVTGKGGAQWRSSMSHLLSVCHWWLCPEVPGPGIQARIVGCLSLAPLLPLLRESCLDAIKNSRRLFTVCSPTLSHYLRA